MAKKSKEIAKRNNINTPMGLESMEADAGAGLENATTEDFQIPYIKLLQALSPELKKRDIKYVPGAEEGMILNSGTGEFWDSEEGIIVLPVSFDFNIIEWAGEKRGQLIAVHDRKNPPTPFAKNDKNESILENGNVLRPTASHYVLIVNPENPNISERAVISMASSQLKISRRWMSLIGAIQKLKTDGTPFVPPSFSHFYRLTTAVDSNDRGEWWNWVIHNEGMLQKKHEELYKTALLFNRAHQTGLVRSRMVEEEVENLSENVM